MTDKQIIIDGEQCQYLSNTGLCRLVYNLTEKSYEHSMCKKNHNCYYKQLKRKEKSEEKLVKQIQTICDFINNRPETFKGVNGSVDKIITDYAERKEQECEELKAKFELFKTSNQTTIDQLKKENEELKKQLESTKGLVTVGNRQLTEALLELQKYKDNEQREIELNKIRADGFKEMQKTLYEKFNGNSLIEKRSPYEN